MFGRKKRVQASPYFGNGPKASSSAQTAAALAFLTPQASNTSLSAAAAAAALRARPTTPTSVADVQTKRTMRRTNSNSSVGSSVSGSVRGPPGAQLERRGSSGSMTDRTFREPSPNRGSTRPSMDDAPPVPAIPKNLAVTAATNSHKRASSMETPVMPRIASPLPHPATGRGTSLDPYRGTQTPKRSAQRLSSLSSVQELTGVERPQSRGSVNFSYPIGRREMAQYGQRRLTSPTFSSASHSTFSGQKQNLVYDPNTRSFLPETELLFIEQQVRDASERPARRNKKATSQVVTGTYLSEGTIGGRMHGTAVNASNNAGSTSKPVGNPQPPSQPARTPVARAKNKKPATSDITHGRESQTSSVSEYDSDNSENPMKMNTRAGALLVKKPSIVREEREIEEAEDESGKALERQAALKKLESRSLDARPISPVGLSKPNTPMGHGRGSALTSTTNGDSLQQTRSTSSPAPTFSTETTATSTVEPATVKAEEGKARNVKPARVQSISPVRNAHFLTTPESLAVKHHPPARSISPRKSALKPSPSSRGSSPNGELPAGSPTNRVSSLSDNSDTSTAVSEERILTRKKSVRVSFDDESNVVLGRADTPVTSDTPVLQSPQNKRGWLSGMGRSKKVDLSEMDDDDEVMKPRPALPSFGSVREKKTRESEERPLVKPTDFNVPAPLASPIYTTATGEAFEHPLGQSQDHALGPLLMQDHVSKNAANISKSREPLPPEVTSVEGSGYISDSESSVGTTEHIVHESEPIPEEPILENPKVEQIPEGGEESEHSQTGHSESSIPPSSTPSRDEPEVAMAKTNGNGAVPSLALTRASPTIDEPEKDGQWPYIIGGFPSSDESGLDDSQASIVEHYPTELTPSAVGIAEPEPVLRLNGLPVIGEIAAQNILHHPIETGEDAEDSNDSVYSDAAEDLSDMQGDGFMSLDAVVDSPIVLNAPGLVASTPPDSPTTRGLREKPYAKSDSPAEPPAPAQNESWDKTQEYWSGLTSEKRKEMERTARGESDESSEEDEKPLVEPKITKRVVVKTPTVSPQTSQRKKEYYSERTYQITPGAKAGPHGPPPTMRSSMRTSSPKNEAAVHMRSSMRTPPPAEEQTHMRKSMREGGSLRGSMHGTSGTGLSSSQSKTSLQKKYRPMSIPQSEIKPDPVEVNKHVRSMSSGFPATSSATKPTPTLRRRGSADSDSSFKRARPVTEGYSMKRSLRGQQARQPTSDPQSPELAPSTMRSSRFSLRSLSPTGSTSRPEPSTGLGRTLRNNRGFTAESSGPTLRPQVPETTKPTSRFPGFGKSKPQVKAKAGPSRASRFADSSDDEDEVRPAFRSRFVNSSDEEDEVAPRPTAGKMPMSLRSATQRTNVEDGDSSDLLDTDDEKPDRVSKTTKVVVPVRAATPSHAGNALASGSLRRSGSGRDFIGATTTTSITAGVIVRPKQNRRSSFMSILRRKKPDPTSKVQKIDGESGARRDTPLERTRADLRAVRQDSNFSMTSMTGSPKLQKRGGPKRTGTSETLENWPLSSPHPDTSFAGVDDERPSAIDGPDDEKQLENGIGAALSGRSDLGPRRTTTGLASVDLSNVLPIKKKKKFGKLRRALGIHD